MYIQFIKIYNIVNSLKHKLEQILQYINLQIFVIFVEKLWRLEINLQIFVIFVEKIVDKQILQIFANFCNFLQILQYFNLQILCNMLIYKYL